MQGRVKFFRAENCWGVITDPETNQKYHVHINDVIERAYLERNQWVSFDLSDRNGRRSAINVVPIDCPPDRSDTKATRSHFIERTTSELTILFVIYPWSARIRERLSCDRGGVKCLFTDVSRNRMQPHPTPPRSSFWMKPAEPCNPLLRGRSSRNRIIGACRFSVRMGMHRCRFRLAPCFQMTIECPMPRSKGR